MEAALREALEISWISGAKCCGTCERVKRESRAFWYSSKKFTVMEYVVWVRNLKTKLWGHLRTMLSCLDFI